jgi:hypothetical protein
MDIVYICRNGDNEELRYSIRSAVKNLKHDNLWVVGGKPDWYTGNHISVPQRGQKFDNARANMREIVASPEISDNFILMNDDFFIMSRVEKITVYHGGLLSARIRNLQIKYRFSVYISLLQKTYKFLREKGIEKPLDYSLHIPFVMNKKKLGPVLDLNLSWRNAYGNMYSIGGKEVEVTDGFSKDVKVYVRQGKPEGLSKNSLTDKFLSTQDNSFELMRPMLEEMFPDPSPYEVGSMGLEPMTDGL